MFLLRFIAIIVLFISISACAITPNSNNYLVETAGPYRLDTGDIIRVSVYGDKDLTGNFQVSDAGTISYPLVGQINARSFTTKQIAANITAALSNGYMRNPNVAVEIATYRPFFIQGEVTRSGQYPYVYGMTVRAAIAVAGGFSDVAERNKVVIYRKRGAEMIKGTVKLDFPIQPGDTIVILDRWL